MAAMRAKDVDKCGAAPEAGSLLFKDAAVAVAPAPAMKPLNGSTVGSVDVAVAEEGSVVGVRSEEVSVRKRDII